MDPTKSRVYVGPRVTRLVYLKIMTRRKLLIVARMKVDDMPNNIRLTWALTVPEDCFLFLSNITIVPMR